jgi:hypothetical protein
MTITVLFFLIITVNLRDILNLRNSNFDFFILILGKNKEPEKKVPEMPRFSGLRF